MDDPKLLIRSVQRLLAKDLGIASELSGEVERAQQMLDEVWQYLDELDQGSEDEDEDELKRLRKELQAAERKIGQAIDVLES